ncbi:MULTISPECIES: hypothetical protein [unclassified Fusibacter]|uniref:hypothetical protein n=1 Tax=unclassified Fusibacter TaxID=2624464 RepID=UPI00101177B2|nr:MULTISPECIES: hypothetical protein [unclassified Fusibacter]MCK8058405.1 hypothetical protein [Fusibacter sp. A2]NPE23876.1 hypothetical protein [Fusibacter sp. A1]RXV58527.1 hypothetical protein DWB64_19000 [Fusibacter sp. A1]
MINYLTENIEVSIFVGVFLTFSVYLLGFAMRGVWTKYDAPISHSTAKQFLAILMIFAVSMVIKKFIGTQVYRWTVNFYIIIQIAIWIFLMQYQRYLLMKLDSNTTFRPNVKVYYIIIALLLFHIAIIVPNIVKDLYGSYKILGTSENGEILGIVNLLIVSLIIYSITILSYGYAISVSLLNFLKKFEFQIDKEKVLCYLVGTNRTHYIIKPLSNNLVLKQVQRESVTSIEAIDMGSKSRKIHDLFEHIHKI